MNEKARKLRLIAKLKKINDHSLLQELESVMDKNNAGAEGGKRPVDFAGIWTEEKAEEIKRLIEEGSERINPDDWK